MKIGILEFLLQPPLITPVKSILLLGSYLASGSLFLQAADPTFDGLPPIKAYSFESIGAVSRSARVSFDGFGRLVVVEEGTYAVLYDSVWLDLVDDRIEESDILCVSQGADGRSYYGAFGDYGHVSLRRDGMVHGISFATCGDEDWTKTAIFDDIVVTSGGVYFGSWNGIAYYEHGTERTLCFPTFDINEIFRVGERAFASSADFGICAIDVESGRLTPLGVRKAQRIEYAASLNDDWALLADSEGMIWTFDGSEMQLWRAQEDLGLRGEICGLQSLVDGGMAIAILGEGIYLVNGENELALALETPEYHRVYNMGANEPGVLWVVSDRSIDKIQYGSPLTDFGQRLGLSLEWPQVAILDDRLLVASDGKLYEAIDPGDGRASHFKLAPTQLPGDLNYLVSGNGHVLVGDYANVYSMLPNGEFQKVASVEGLINLAMMGDDRCLAIGKSGIAALGFRQGKWREIAPRAEGLNYGPIVHSTEDAVWVEMGGEGAARLWLEDGELKRLTLRNDGWTTARWVNVGVIDDIVVLNGRRGERKFFDESRGEWCRKPDLAALFDRYPKRIDRVAKDDDGVIWATHSEGIVRFVPTNGDYLVDAYGLDMINDRYPRVQVLNGNDVWIVAGRSLLRVKKRNAVARSGALKPMLVSLQVGDDREEFVRPGQNPSAGAYEFPYARSRLSFRLFSGGYGWRSVPAYDYRLSEKEDWARVDSNSLLTFGNLSPGRYALQVRPADESHAADFWTVVDFRILVPWYRAGFAYALYAGAFAGVLGLGMKFSSHIVRARNRELERLVEERTSQLRSTMDRLNEETRHSATLAERNRLAGEIHDSLQQGIIGAIIQLDATLESSSVSSEVQSRLKIVRNMVSYVRQEVQHLVWDLDTTLHDSELGDVLRSMVTLMNSETSIVELRESGAPAKLPYRVRHNLLRIAQESTTNALRHSGASKISIELSYTDGGVSLCIGDNGVGFDPDRALVAGIGHFGLRGIRSRANRLKGRLSVDSAPGEGTRIRVSVPVGKEEMIYGTV